MWGSLKQSRAVSGYSTSTLGKCGSSQCSSLYGPKSLGSDLPPLHGDVRSGKRRPKVGLMGGTVSRTIGAWDFTPNPLLYRLYTQILPRLMDIMRSRGKQRTRQSLGA